LEADGWDPKKITGRSGKSLSWKCNFGHTWNATVANRTSNRPTGCPVCKRRKVQVGINDLASTHPSIAEEAFDWDPALVLAGSRETKKWKCKSGHIYSATLYGRTGPRKSGCSICSGQKLVTGINDLLSTHPRIAEEAVGWKPNKFHGGSKLKKKWKCPLGHTYLALISTRTRTNSGCHYCSNLKVLNGFNDLLTTHPNLAAQADGWDPKKVIAGSHKRVAWKCSEGHRWKTNLGSRTGKTETGCPSCEISGFNPNEKSWLYFLFHSKWGMYQIGITNDLKRRLSKHSLNGWDYVESRGPMDGLATQQWETAILRMLKAKGADLSNSKIAGKFDGYSEAWSKSTFPVKSIKELMRLTEEFEEN
jgi:hypothetical protein